MPSAEYLAGGVVITSIWCKLPEGCELRNATNPFISILSSRPFSRNIIFPLLIMLITSSCTIIPGVCFSISIKFDATALSFWASNTMRSIFRCVRGVLDVTTTSAKSVAAESNITLIEISLSSPLNL